MRGYEKYNGAKTFGRRQSPGNTTAISGAVEPIERKMLCKVERQTGGALSSKPAARLRGPGRHRVGGV
eukprot:2688201-Pyramimonas_sp.AAC.1